MRNKSVSNDDNALPHTTKSINAFHQERYVTLMTWSANSPNLNLTENLWWKLQCKTKTNKKINQSTY